jgi:hypothetical protein
VISIPLKASHRVFAPMSDLPPHFQLSRVLLVSLGLGTAITCLSIVLDHGDFPPVLVRGWPVPFVSWDSTPGARLDFGVYALPLAYDVLVWTGWCFIITCMAVTVWITPPRSRRRRRDAAKACVTCGYSLTGNVSGICPECGTPVQRLVRQRRWRIPMTWVKYAGVALGVLAVLWIGVSSGWSVELCSGCGARSKVWHFSLYGLGGEYGRSVCEGPISKAIQAWSAARCSHSWELADSCRGDFRGQAYGVGRGHGRYRAVKMLEDQANVLPQFFKHEMGEDSGFVTALKQAIQGSGRDEAAESYLNSLLGKLGEFRPAAMASQPAGGGNSPNAGNR